MTLMTTFAARPSRPLCRSVGRRLSWSGDVGGRGPPSPPGTPTPLRGPRAPVGARLGDLVLLSLCVDKMSGLNIKPR